jgi:hypothetical protein
MSRELSDAVANALDDAVVYPFFAVELLFDGGTFIPIGEEEPVDKILRMWTGVGTLVYDSVEWFGTGNLLNISSVEETTEISAKGATITLSGVPSEVISLALSQPYQGRICKIYFGMFSKGQILDEGGNYILLEDGGKIHLENTETDLTEIFSGYMDQMNISEGPDASTIELAVENKLVDLERSRVRRFTSAYQKSVYPNDLGLDFVEDLQDKDITWGRKSGS